MPQAWNQQHITTTTVVVNPGQLAHTVAPASFIFHGVVINSAAAAATVAIYDDNSSTSPGTGSGSLIASIAPSGTANTYPAPTFYDCVNKVGLTIVITGTADVTALWE